MKLQITLNGKLKKAEEGRQKPEDSVHKGIQTPPEREPVNNVQWGLDTLTPFSRGLHVEGIPSSSCLLPSAFLVIPEEFFG